MIGWLPLSTYELTIYLACHMIFLAFSW